MVSVMGSPEMAALASCSTESTGLSACNCAERNKLRKIA